MEKYNCYIKGYALPHFKVGSSVYVVERNGLVISSKSKLYSCPDNIDPLKFHFYCELLAAREALKECHEGSIVNIYTSEVIIANWLTNRCKKAEYKEWIDVIKRLFRNHESVNVCYYKNGGDLSMFDTVIQLAHETAKLYKPE